MQHSSCLRDYTHIDKTHKIFYEEIEVNFSIAKKSNRYIRLPISIEDLKSILDSLKKINKGNINNLNKTFFGHYAADQISHNLKNKVNTKDYCIISNLEEINKELDDILFYINRISSNNIINIINLKINEIKTEDTPSIKIKLIEELYKLIEPLKYSQN